jgi:hypothetical protein
MSTEFIFITKKKCERIFLNAFFAILRSALNLMFIFCERKSIVAKIITLQILHYTELQSMFSLQLLSLDVPKIFLFPVKLRPAFNIRYISFYEKLGGWSIHRFQGSQLSYNTTVYSV